MPLIIFVHSSTLKHISIKPMINGLCDHDAQLLVIKNINHVSNFHNYEKLTRVVNDATINEFMKCLVSEDWELLLSGGIVYSEFNSFMNIISRIFE